MAVPYTFAGATSAIPLSQLDTNFATTFTLGNTAIQLGNTVTTLNNMTLANVTISSGNVTITNVSVTTANVTTGNITTLTSTNATITNMSSGNVTITGGTINGTTLGATTASSANVTTLTTSSTVTLNGGTANGVAYLNGSKVLTTGSALVFDGSNLGLGVTPSAWKSTYRSYDVGTAALGSTTGVSISLQTANAYLNASDQYIYKITDAASSYRQLQGAHAWFTAPSGTAGTAITFTQAMTLTSGGNLLVGTTSDTARLAVQGSTTSAGATGTAAWFSDGVLSTLYIQNKSGVAYITGNDTLGFATKAAGVVDSVERARITSGGDLLVGTTTNTYSSKIVSNAGITDFGTQYNVNLSGADYSFVQRGANRGFAFYVNAAGTVATLSSAGVWTDASDARYKENVQPTRYGLDAVMQLKPREYNLIGQSKKQVGFIAQEVLDVVPEVVDLVFNSITNEDRYTLSYGQMTAVLTKAIQELKAELDTVKAELATLKGN